MEFQLIFKEPEKRVRSLVRKLTHSGEPDLDKEILKELKAICKGSGDEIIVIVYKECIKCLQKEHSQVRVATVKLIDYLFRKAHCFRTKLLENFDNFLELTLAISQKPEIKLILPPPKKHAALLQELTAKTIHTWHADFAEGYEKLRYAHRYLREHKLVDFSRFRVQTHEESIRRKKLAENQEKLLSKSIENRLKELEGLKPETEQILAQIESLLDLLIIPTDLIQDGNHGVTVVASDAPLEDETFKEKSQRQHHGIANLSQSIDINFSPYLEVKKTYDNEGIIQNLKELKKQLVESKLAKLISIEKTISKRSDQFVGILKEIIDLKGKSANLILKLGELKLFNEAEDGTKKKMLTLDDSGSGSESEFEEVEPKEGLETYIPKNLRIEYGLEAIDPREISSTSKVTLTNEIFDPIATCSSSSGDLPIACGVRLDSGKLCSRRDKIKCPFHGKIISRDHNGVPIDEDERRKEEMRSKSKPVIPEWQDPQLLADIKGATGIDLTMPKKGRSKTNQSKNLANTKTCDLTPQQRLKKKLKLLTKC